MHGTAFPLTLFPGSLPGALAGAGYSALLCAAAASDVRARRIPNAVVGALGALGVAFGAATLGAAGVERALVGVALGLALWLPFHALRMLGAGDVKLFAAACAWLAPSQVFAAAFATALLGAALSIASLLLAHGVAVTSARLAHAASDPSVLTRPLPVPAGRRTLPYGIAMAAALSLVAWVPRVMRAP